MTAVLSVCDLSVSFGHRGVLAGLLGTGGGSVAIVDTLSLDVEAGETLGLVGESGSGKTTLARAVLGLHRADGRVVFEGREIVSESDRRAMRQKSAMMFQDPVGSLSPRLRVGTLLTEPRVIRGESMPDRKALARRMLADVGLPASFVDRYPHELSGGQARRVGVARALSLRPRLLIADEPTAGLDVSVQGDVLNLIADLQAQLGFAAIIVTHNLAVVRHVCDRLAIMYLGRLVETGPTGDVFARPLHPYTASLISAEPVPDPRRRRPDLKIRGEIPSVLRRPSGCEFHTRCPNVRDRCRSEAPKEREMAPGRRVRCHFPLVASGQFGEAAAGAALNQRGNT
jgi:peptide/nickel transport system ATP-binding protein